MGRAEAVFDDAAAIRAAGSAPLEAGGAGAPPGAIAQRGARSRASGYTSAARRARAFHERDERNTIFFEVSGTMAARNAKVKKGDYLLLVGTMKGAFVLHSGPRRDRWVCSEPLFAGHSVYAMACDARRAKPRLWAGVQSSHFGSTLRSSDDFGETWHNPQLPKIQFPKDTNLALGNIWQITPGRDDEPQHLLCGVDPAGLFESRDGGESFDLVRGLHNHPHRAKWMPGFGGLCLHTIELDPDDKNQMWVGVSSAGVYHTSDGGKSWKTSHKGVRADFHPEKFPEFGQCVHKFARHPENGKRFYLQNHGGVYRSDDRGHTWIDIGKGLPADFGFGLGIHPRDPNVAFVIPLQADAFRVTPGAKLRVFRTSDAGKTWRALSKGLPQKGAYETVLRDALAVEDSDPIGVYFGTRSGKLYASRDAGDSWKLIVDGLPPITCVKAARIATPARAKSKRTIPRKRAR